MTDGSFRFGLSSLEVNTTFPILASCPQSLRRAALICFLAYFDSLSKWSPLSFLRLDEPVSKATPTSPGISDLRAVVKTK